MPHALSLALSVAFTVTYVLLAIRHRRASGRGGLYVKTVCWSLGAFWLLRSIGYGLLLTTHQLMMVNDFMRWSAYLTVAPALVMVAVELRTAP